MDKLQLFASEILLFMNLIFANSMDICKKEKLTGKEKKHCLKVSLSFAHARWLTLSVYLYVLFFLSEWMRLSVYVCVT